MPTDDPATPGGWELVTIDAASGKVGDVNCSGLGPIALRLRASGVSFVRRERKDSGLADTIRKRPRKHCLANLALLSRAQLAPTFIARSLWGFWVGRFGRGLMGSSRLMSRTGSARSLTRAAARLLHTVDHPKCRRQGQVWHTVRRARGEHRVAAHALRVRRGLRARR